MATQNFPQPTPFRPVYWENRFNNGDVVVPGYYVEGGPGGYPWYTTSEYFLQRPYPHNWFNNLDYRQRYGYRREYVPLWGNRRRCFTMQRYNDGFEIATRAVRTPCPWDVSLQFP